MEYKKFLSLQHRYRRIQKGETSRRRAPPCRPGQNMFGRLTDRHGDGRDGIGEETGKQSAHRLQECNRPNITCPGNQTGGSIFSHPYSEKISTPCLNGRLVDQKRVTARGQTGSGHSRSFAMVGLRKHGGQYHWAAIQNRISL